MARFGRVVALLTIGRVRGQLGIGAVARDKGSKTPPGPVPPHLLARGERSRPFTVPVQRGKRGGTIDWFQRDEGSGYGFQVHAVLGQGGRVPDIRLLG